MRMIGQRVLAATAIAAAMATAASAATLVTSDGPVRVRNWGYQLQGATSAGLQTAPLAAAPHDLVVLDFARYGDEANKFSPAEIAAIKNGTGGDQQRKVALAYVSIGEASEFRSHWDAGWTQTGQADAPLTASAPAWLGPVNPDWTESRKVRYWDPAWQSVIYNAGSSGWLDQVVVQGFDGAYLDIVDAYYFWGEEATPAERVAGDPADVQDAARRMAQFVVDMTAHARQTNSAFFVFPQNGEFILNDLAYGGTPEPGDPALRAAYLDAIGGIGIEDTYYTGDADVNNPLAIDADKVAVLQQDFLAADKPVFVVDYLNAPAKASNFQTLARADGFIPYAAPTRDLDTLGPTAPSLAGDFNNDGQTGGGDLQLWQSHYGSIAQLDADANENGRVDGGDFLAWQRGMATPAPPTAAVPEPATTPLAAIAAALLIATRSPRLARCTGRFHVTG